MKKVANLDLTSLDDEERTEFQNLLDDANKYRIQRWDRMLNAVEPVDSELRDMIDAEYGLSGAYLNGDQLASYEVSYR